MLTGSNKNLLQAVYRILSSRIIKTTLKLAVSNE